MPIDDEYHQRHGNLELFDYLVAYRKYPGIEYLVKAGYSNYVSSIRSLNRNGHNFSEIFGVDQKWAKYLKRAGIRELRLIRKYPWLRDAEEVENLESIQDELKYRSYLDDKDALHSLNEQDYKYMLKNYKDVYSIGTIYVDYLRFANSLGYPLEEARYRHPRNLITAHDKLADEFQGFKNRKQDEKIAKYSKQANKYSWSEKNLCIFPVKKSRELITESEVLHHCVRTYINKVADGKSMIFFVRHKDNPEIPYVTLELIDKKITQVYGEHDTKPNDDACQFVMDWKKKFKFNGWSAEGNYRYN